MSYQETKGTWLKIRARYSWGISMQRETEKIWEELALIELLPSRRQGAGIIYIPCVWKGSRQ